MIGPPGPAYGDTISGTNLAGGIAAALLKRERTGEPSVVDVSLLGSGLWSMGHTVALTKHLDQRWKPPAGCARLARTIRWWGCTRPPDGRYISFVMMQPSKFWADVCQHVDLPELADDPRFATIEKIAANTAEAVEILTKAIATRTLAEWSERFATLAGPLGAGAGHARRRPTMRRSGRTNMWCRQANSNWSPTRSSSTSPRRRSGPAPGFAEQTDEILLELGSRLGPHHRTQNCRRRH